MAQGSMTDFDSIKVVIGEGLAQRESPTPTPVSRVRNVVAFSFRHAPIGEIRDRIQESPELTSTDWLEDAGIAWPNPYLTHDISTAKAVPAFHIPSSESSHVHSPRGNQKYGQLFRNVMSFLPPAPPPPDFPLPNIGWQKSHGSSENDLQVRAEVGFKSVSDQSEGTLWDWESFNALQPSALLKPPQDYPATMNLPFLAGGVHSDVSMPDAGQSSRNGRTGQSQSQSQSEDSAADYWAQYSEGPCYSEMAALDEDEVLRFMLQPPANTPASNKGEGSSDESRMPGFAPTFSLPAPHEIRSRKEALCGSCPRPNFEIPGPIRSGRRAGSHPGGVGMKTGARRSQQHRVFSHSYVDSKLPRSPLESLCMGRFTVPPQSNSSSDSFRPLIGSSVDFQLQPPLTSLGTLDSGHAAGESVPADSDEAFSLGSIQ